MSELRIATRGSALARWQADRVAARLFESSGRAAELVIVETQGDRDKSSPLHSIGGKGVFCKEVQAAVLDGRADLAVHSAKDLPAETPDGLTLAAIPERGRPNDALVGARLDDLAPGATVATGSVRRRAQLRRIRADLQFVELRGNMDTRLAKAAEHDAIVVAAVALERLGERPEVVDELPVDVMIPQVGQGALAIECRVDDPDTANALASIHDDEVGRLVRAERAFLRELGGDCSLPAAAHARWDTAAGGPITVAGFLASEDLETSHTATANGADGEALGVALAQQLRNELA